MNVTLVTYSRDAGHGMSVIPSPIVGTRSTGSLCIRWWVFAFVAQIVECGKGCS